MLGTFCNVPDPITDATCTRRVLASSERNSAYESDESDRAGIFTVRHRERGRAELYLQIVRLVTVKCIQHNACADWIYHNRCSDIISRPCRIHVTVTTRLSVVGALISPIGTTPYPIEFKARVARPVGPSDAPPPLKIPKRAQFNCQGKGTGQRRLHLCARAARSR